MAKSKEIKKKKIESMEEGDQVCPVCGNIMIDESGTLVCPHCQGEIDFFGDEND